MATVNDPLRPTPIFQLSELQLNAMATINDLPDELLCNIFDHVARRPICVNEGEDEPDRYPSPILALSRTCRRFNKIAPPYLVRSWSLLNQKKNPAPFLKHLLAHPGQQKHVKHLLLQWAHEGVGNCRCSMTDYVELDADQKAAFSAAASHPIFSQLDASKDNSFEPSKESSVTDDENDHTLQNSSEYSDSDDMEWHEQWKVFDNKFKLLVSGHIEAMLTLMVFHAPRLESLVIARQICSGEGDEEEPNALDGFVFLDALELCLRLHQEKYQTLGTVGYSIPFMSLRRLFLGAQASGEVQVLGLLYPIMKLPNLEELYVWHLHGVIYSLEKWKALCGQSTVRKLCIQQVYHGRDLFLMIDACKQLVAFHIQETPESQKSWTPGLRVTRSSFTHLIPSLAKHARSLRKLGFQTNEADNVELIRDFVLQLPRLRFLRVDVGSGFGPKIAPNDAKFIQIVNILPRSIQTLFMYVGGATRAADEQRDNKPELSALYDACVKGELSKLKSLVVFTNPDDPMETPNGMKENFAALGIQFKFGRRDFTWLDHRWSRIATDFGVHRDTMFQSVLGFRQSYGDHQKHAVWV